MSSKDARSSGGAMAYVLVLPLCWAVCSLLHFREPGDEYALYFVSSLAGSWFLILGLVETGDIHQIWIPWSVAGVGAVVMAAVGGLLAAVRLRPGHWLLLFACATGFVFQQVLRSFPSIDHALAKNGSWQAYVYFSCLIGSYLASVVGLVLAVVLRCVRRPR